MGELVAAVVDEVVVVVVVVVVDEVVVCEVVLEAGVAIQLHALLTRLATFPVQAATANDGITLVAVTGAVVKVPQNSCAASTRSLARKARRQLSALQLAAHAVAGRRTAGRRREERRGIVSVDRKDRVYLANLALRLN